MEDDKLIELTAENRKVVYRLVKDPKGYPFYYFKVSGSAVPKELEGRFSSVESAKRQLALFDRSATQSRAVRNEELAKFREARREKSESKG